MRVLVTAASRHDSTLRIAEAIADGLERRGVGAQARPIEHVRDLAGYDAVVLGSAVYTGRWLRSALRFAGAHAAELASMPVWLFSSGPLGPPGQRVPETEPADVTEMVALTSARAHRLFGGHLDRRLLNMAERMLVRAVHARYGDDREWEAIDGYAAEIAASLEREAAVR